MDLFVLDVLVLNITFYACFIAFLADCSDVVSFGPEFPSPQLFPDLGNPFEHFSGCNTFYNLGYIGRTDWWDTLDEKMNMILVCSDFEKMYVVSLLDFKTYLFELLIETIDIFENFLAVLGWTDQMVD